VLQSPIRVSPEMTSRKLQALDFIKHYYLRHGASPTLGEIAAGLGVSRQRAFALVDALEREGLVKRVRGQSRGIMLANAAAQVSESDALLQLQAAGWRVLVGSQELGQPFAAPLTDQGLSDLPYLDHLPAVELDGDGDDRIEERR
jgi:SOS-response transcriptional repressor LexA